jgi:ribosomal protein S18 acetylase RimI-like enzyme
MKKLPRFSSNMDVFKSQSPMTAEEIEAQMARPHGFSTIDSFDPPLIPALESDLDWLLELRERTMRPVIERHGGWEDAAQLERVLLHYGHTRIVVLEGARVGMLKVVPHTSEIELLQIQILPEWQQRGIGGRLIRKLQRDCMEKDLPITLRVFRSNPAISLYRMLGFNYVNTGAESHLMRWEVPRCPPSRP